MKPTKKLNKRQSDTSTRAAIEQLIEIERKGNLLENLISNNSDVSQILGVLLVELSNESNTGCEAPGVAGNFYVAAVRNSIFIDRPHYALKATLRHIDALLNSPTAENAAAIEKFLDDAPTADRYDPFPEKATKRTRKGGRNA